MPKVPKKLKMPKNPKMPRLSRLPRFEMAEIAETEILRFLETFNIWVFFGNIDGLFEKIWYVFDIANCGKFAVECVSISFFFSKVSFALFMKFVWQKNRELWTLEKWNYDEEKVLFQKNLFHLFESLLYKNGKAHSLLVVAGRLV